jgi:hypothetical protein
LTAFLGFSHIDADGLEPPCVFSMQFGIDNMEGLLSSVEAFFDKRKQQSILLVSTGKEPTDMAFCAKLGAGEANRLFALSPRSSRTRLALRLLFCFTVGISGFHIALLLSNDWLIKDR